MLVQSLCSLSVVFALPLGWRFTGQRVNRRSIIGAAVTVAGISLFVILGNPQSGTSQPENREWLISGLLFAAVITLLAWQGSRRRGTLSAIFYAAAAGMDFAFQAAVTKEFTVVIQGGVSAALVSWTTYALIGTAVAGLGLQQSALKTGYLAVTMATVNAAVLAMSALLGVILFEETLVSGSGLLSPGFICLGVAILGVILFATADKTPEPAAG
jgi:drug/metabolite transporter (DMT)-like permease